MTTQVDVAKIMVVDDHVNLAENLAEILEGEGYQALIAVSAEQALETLSRDQVDGLITDYRLPGMSGAQLIGELRRMGRRIPSVVMSAYSDDNTIAAARSAGAIEVLGKPVVLAQLLLLVAGMRQGRC